MFSLFSSAENDSSATKPPTADQESSFLSDVSSWLGFGKSASAADSQAKEDVDFETEDAEQDWVLVDKKEPTPQAMGQERQRVLDYLPTRKAGDEEDELHIDSTTSTYQVENDWVMTPRPCFTLQPDATALEHHDYEDLLIERASMSFYSFLIDPSLMQDALVKDLLLQIPSLEDDDDSQNTMPPERVRSDHSGTMKALVKKTRRPKNPSPWAAQAHDNCGQGIETRVEMLERVKAVKSSQRKQQQKERQGLSRKHLAQLNRNTLAQSQARRNNRARNTSGAMKSRTPQRRH